MPFWILTLRFNSLFKFLPKIIAIKINIKNDCDKFDTFNTQSYGLLNLVVKWLFTVVYNAGVKS